MGHNISALVIKGPLLDHRLPEYDLEAVRLEYNRLPLTLVWMDIHYTEHWQRKLGCSGNLRLPDTITIHHLMPHESCILEIAQALSESDPVEFAIVWTDYFGGVGQQAAAAFRGEDTVSTDGTINGALRELGVKRRPGKDEFDTVGLDHHRHIPDDVLDRWEKYQSE